MAAPALRAGPDGFVVADDRGRCGLSVEEIGVDRAEPADQAVGGRFHPQLLPAAHAALGGDGERHVLVEGAAGDEVGDVLAGGALALRVALGDGLGALVVEDHLVQVAVELEVGPDPVEVDLRLDPAQLGALAGRLEEEQRVPLVDRVADLHGDLADQARAFSGDHVLHLHRGHDHQLLARLDGAALGDQDLDDRALNRRAQRLRAGRCRDVGRDGGVGCGDVGLGAAALAGAEEIERGERVAQAVLDDRAGVASRARADRGRLDRLHQLGRVLVDPARVEVGGGEGFVREDALEEADIAGDALQLELGQRPGRATGRLLVAAVRARDHLGAERIEVRIGRVALRAVAVDADAGPGRRPIAGQRAARRPHFAVGVDSFEIHAGLDRRTPRRRRLGQADLRQRSAFRDGQLAAHEVEPRDLLRHRVLDLQAGIGLDEGELAGPVEVDEELERAQILITAGPRERDRGLEYPRAQVHIQRRCRRDLDHFLVAPLQRALALPNMRDRSVPVGRDLHFDVPRPRDEPLGEDGAVAERGLGLRGAARERVLDLLGPVNRAQPAPAAAGDRLEHDRRAAVLPEKAPHAVQIQ